MKLSLFKQYVGTVGVPVFELRNGKSVPSHYHLTEVWLITKQFIDCGWVERTSKKVSLQLRYASDVDHRLESSKLLDIIDMYEQKIDAWDYDVQIEYQSDTVGIYDLERYNGAFVLMPTKTDCLAKDTCGIPSQSDPANLMWWWSWCCGGWGCC